MMSVLGARARCSCSVLVLGARARCSGKIWCSVLMLVLGKIEVLSARARYRAPNARALLITAYN